MKLTSSFLFLYCQYKKCNVMENITNKQTFREYLDECFRKKRVEISYVQRFFRMSVNKQNKILDKLIEKYNSEEYINRWHKRNMTPENKLWWILFDWCVENYEAEREGDLCVMYTINNEYVLRGMFGQGGEVTMYKKNLNTI